MSVMKVIDKKANGGAVQLDGLPAGTVFELEGSAYLMVDASGEETLKSHEYFYAVDLRDYTLSWFSRGTSGNRGPVLTAELRIKRPC